MKLLPAALLLLVALPVAIGTGIVGLVLGLFWLAGSPLQDSGRGLVGGLATIAALMTHFFGWAALVPLVEDAKRSRR